VDPDYYGVLSVSAYILVHRGPRQRDCVYINAWLLFLHQEFVKVHVLVHFSLSLYLSPLYSDSVRRTLGGWFFYRRWPDISASSGYIILFCPSNPARQ